MTERELTQILHRFRRQMAYATIVRWVLFAGLVLSLAAAGPLGSPRTATVASISLVLLLAGWILLVFLSAKTVRGAHLGVMLLSGGHVSEAEEELVRSLQGVSVFRSALLMAGQNLGALLHGRQQYEQAGGLLRLLARYARGGRGAAQPFQTTIRLLLADTELSLGNLDAAYEALRPVFGLPLTLSDRLMLLPISLRYELATGHTKSAVTNLAEKMRHAELLESPQAAWVHTLLAEACRREGLAEQADFLARRAALYHDPADLPEALAMPNLAGDTGAQT